MPKQILFFFATIGLLICPMLNFGQTTNKAAAPTIGKAVKFAIYTGSGAISNNNSVVNTSVLGDIGNGDGAIGGFIPALTKGVVRSGDAADPIAIAAKPDVQAAFDYLKGLKASTSTYVPSVITTIGGGMTLYPGVTFLNAAAILTGNLTLDAKNDTSGVFIILIGGAFGTGAGSTVTFINKAVPSHVYWWVDGAAVLYANTTFQGSIFVNGQLDIKSGIIINGRALVTTGAINMDGTTFQGASQIDSIAVVVAVAAASTATKVNVHVQLQGAMQSGGNLGTSLSTNNLIPLGNPYSAAPFNHVATYVEGITNIPAVSGGGVGVVDWVMVELLDPTTNAVVDSRTAFLGSDGNIMEVDGTAGVTFLKTNLVNGHSYNIGIRHRNHLAVRTKNPQVFTQGGSVTVDLTTLANVYTNSAITNNKPMALLSNGSYAMWAGDENSNGMVSYVGTASDAGNLYNSILGSNISQQLTTYNNGDLNLDGKTSYSAAGFPPFMNNDADFLLSTVLGHNKYAVIFQHY